MDKSDSTPSAPDIDVGELSLQDAIPEEPEGFHQSDSSNSFTRSIGSGLKKDTGPVSPILKGKAIDLEISIPDMEDLVTLNQNIKPIWTPRDSGFQDTAEETPFEGITVPQPPMSMKSAYSRKKENIFKKRTF